MSLLFDDASSQYLQHDAAILTAVPLSMSCRFYSDDTTVDQMLICLVNSASALNRDCFQMFIRGSAAGKNVRATTGGPAGAGVADTTSGYSANTWHTATAVFAASNDRRVYIDGGSKGTNATDQTPSGINRSNIGARRQGTSTLFMSGRIAEAAIWDVALDDSDAAMLALGVSPLLIHPANLVAYWPLIGNSSPALDRVGGYAMTITGATKDEHPRVVMPSKSRLILPAVAAATTVPNLLLLGVGV